MQALIKTARRRLEANEDLVRELGVPLAVALFLAWLGPFGTKGDLSLAARLVYWTASVGAGFAANEAYERLVLPALLRRLPRSLAQLVRLAPITLGAAACVLVLEATLREPVPPGAVLAVFGSVGAVSAAITGVALLVERPAPADDAARPEAAFLERLPAPHREAELYAVASEDHYLRVHTSAGDTLVRGRLADALSDLAGAPGARVHRSWWVADRAVRGMERGGGAWTLVLEGGARAPVSRTYRADVRSRGWTEPRASR